MQNSFPQTFSDFPVVKVELKLRPCTLRKVSTCTDAAKAIDVVNHTSGVLSGKNARVAKNAI